MSSSMEKMPQRTGQEATVPDGWLRREERGAISKKGGAIFGIGIEMRRGLRKMALKVKEDGMRYSVIFEKKGKMKDNYFRLKSINL